MTSSGDSDGIIHQTIREHTHRLAQTQRSVDELAVHISRIGSDKRSILNSFVAYVLFTVLLGGAFFLLYRARVSSVIESRETALFDRDNANERLEQVTKELRSRQLGESWAKEQYDRFVAGDLRVALDKQSEMESLPLSPVEKSVLIGVYEKSKSKLVRQHLEAGALALKQKQYLRAVREYSEAQTIGPKDPLTIDSYYFLGRAYVGLGNAERATAAFKKALDIVPVDGSSGGAGTMTKTKTGIADARFRYAQALESSGKASLAREQYKRFATEHPRNKYAWVARLRAAGKKVPGKW